jgi:hypothetical protein
VLTVLLLALVAMITAVLAMLYARNFNAALQARHAAQQHEVGLLSGSSRILALNDADLYASWRLTRVNVVASAMCAIAVVAIFVFVLQRLR